MFFFVDEIDFYYFLIVSKICYFDDFIWLEIDFNLNVCFYDGKLIIVQDVEFFFEKFMVEGVL